jgi:hypothetical protein
MTTHVTHPSPSVGVRRGGYALALTLNLVLLHLVNVAPGWQAVSFLTERTSEVIWLVNLSLIAGVVTNGVYAAVDLAWVRALGEALSTVVGLASLVLIWRVFPFTFDTSSVPWDLVARWVIGVGIFGAIVGIIAALVRFIRALTHA